MKFAITEDDKDLMPVWKVTWSVLWDHPEQQLSSSFAPPAAGTVVSLDRSYASETEARARLEEVLTGWEDGGACYATRVLLERPREWWIDRPPLVLASYLRSQRGPWNDVLTEREGRA